MRIVLLALDREPARATNILKKRFARADVIVLPRTKLETGNPLERLQTLQKLLPDIFAVSTERLAWQRGQNLLLLFGALAGAARGIILDSDGAVREEYTATTFLRSPFRLAYEAWVSASAVIRARRQLHTLERALNEGAFAAGPKADVVRNPSNGLRLTYLRSIPTAGTCVGGSTTHVNGFIEAALQLGADVTLITNDRIAGLDASRLPQEVIQADPRGLTRATFDLHNALLFTERACDKIIPKPPDFIYQRYCRFNWTGVKASVRTRRPLFLEYNGSEVWVAQHWDRVGLSDLLQRCERLNLAAAARIFVVSEVERRNLERAGVPPEKIIVNPNAADIQRFQSHIGGAALRKEWGLTPDDILVGFAGTFGPWHGVTVLAEAIARIPAAVRMRFLLIGTGSLRDAVESILRDAGVEARAIFTGAVPHERMPLLLDACDVLVSPHVPLADDTEFFGSPTKLFEYMAMGKGIVASRLGQIGEVLEDEKTALLVNPGDPHVLANAIVRLSASSELRQRLGAEARRLCIARYTWKHNAERVLDAYRSLCSERLRTIIDTGPP